MFKAKYLPLIGLAIIIFPAMASANCYLFSDFRKSVEYSLGVPTPNNCGEKTGQERTSNCGQYENTVPKPNTCLCCASGSGCCLINGKATATDIASCYITADQKGQSPQFDINQIPTADGKSCVMSTVGNNNSNVGNNITPSIKLQKDNFSNPASFTSVPGLVNKVINAILGIIGAIALLMYILAGIIWLSSAGNDTSVKTAKNILIWTTIGLVVMFGSFVITQFILNAVSK